MCFCSVLCVNNSTEWHGKVGKMGITIQAKTDYSALLGSLGSSGSMGNLNFLSDYASIKNGSYGKLMRAYYAKDGASDEVSGIAGTKKSTQSSGSKDSPSALTSIKNSAENLKTKVNDLMETEYESVDDAYSAMKDFVSDYNSLISKAGNANASTISSKVTNLVNMTDKYEKTLGEIGITINDDYSLSLDEDKFKNGDTIAMEGLFTGVGSFGYSVASSASLIDSQANYEAMKANTYTNSGAFSKTVSTGNILDSLF